MARIPHIIHYCWFGGNPIPSEYLRYIETWHTFFPDYQIIEWNEHNFNIHIIPYVEEAYLLRKFAFVSDYARLWILYNYGGIYFDTDVEVIKNMQDIVERGCFMGQEDMNSSGISDFMVNPGLGLGFYPHHPVIGELIQKYNHLHFKTWTGKNTGTIVSITTELLLSKLKNIHTHNVSQGNRQVLKCNDIYVYPPEYFCPKNCYTGQCSKTEKTRTIHHYAASWEVKNRSIMTRVFNRIKGILVRLYVSIININKK